MKKGFTLIELILAISVLSIGIVLILQSFMSMLTALDISANDILAMQLLEEKMSQLEQMAKEEDGIAVLEEQEEIRLGKRAGQWKAHVTALEPQPWEELLDEAEAEMGFELEDKEELNKVSVSVSWQQTTKIRDTVLVTYLPAKKDEF